MARETSPVSNTDAFDAARITPAFLSEAGEVPRSGFWRLVARVEIRFASALRWIMFISLLGLALVMVCQVLMRYVLQWPFLGIEEMAPLLALWCYFAGMIYSTRHRSHIEGGVLRSLSSNPAVINAARLVGTAVSLGALLVFIYYAYSIAQFNVSIGRKSVYLRWPRYIWDFAFLGGMAGMAFYLFVQLLFEVRRTVTKAGRV